MDSLMLVLLTSLLHWHCWFLSCWHIFLTDSEIPLHFGPCICLCSFFCTVSLLPLLLKVAILHKLLTLLSYWSASVTLTSLFLSPWLQWFTTDALLLGKSRSIAVIFLLGSRTQHLISITSKYDLLFFLLSMCFFLHFLRMVLPYMQLWKTSMFQLLHIPLLLLFPP